jgi:hypothetical protein
MRGLLDFIGRKNPVPHAILLSRILNATDASEAFRDRFMPEEREGVRKIVEIERDYISSMTIDRENGNQTEEPK